MPRLVTPLAPAAGSDFGAGACPALAVEIDCSVTDRSLNAQAALHIRLVARYPDTVKRLAAVGFPPAEIAMEMLKARERASAIYIKSKIGSTS